MTCHERLERQQAPLRGIRVLCVGASLSAALLSELLNAQGASTVFAGHACPGSRGRLVALMESVSSAPPRGTEVPGPGPGSPGLIASADVVIDPRPADASAPAGWSRSELLSRAGPRAIYCALPAFAYRDERWRGMEGSEEVLAAMLGAYWRGRNGQPTLTAVPISACFGALAAALGVASALLARERYGEGQQVEVSEFDATFLAIGARALTVGGDAAAERPSDPWGGPCRCADARWVWVNLATPKAVRRFAEHVGLAERWERAGFLGRADLGQLSPGRAELRRELSSLFRSRPAHVWDQLAVGLGIPLTLVRTLDEVRATDPDVAQGTSGPPELRRAFRDRAAVVLRASGEDAGRGGQPADVAWSRERPACAAWAAADPDAATAAPLPLAGVRVLDVSQMLAGPVAGRLLAELGATVIKINDPQERGAGYRWQENRYHTDVNRGKATLLVDLKRPGGQSIARRLLTQADVVLENFRQDAARRLGFGRAQLRTAAPSLCHAHISAFSVGSRWDAPGYEPNAQAIAGLMAWDPDSGAPRLQPFAVNDYGTGLLCAFGVTLALYDRLRGGASSYVEASLSRTAFFYAWAMAAGRHERDGAPPACLWRLRDGWIAVTGQPEHTMQRLWALVAKPGDVSVPSSRREALVRGRLRDMRSGEVAAQLARDGLVATRVQSYQSQARRPDLRARGVLVSHRYSETFVMSAVGNPIQLSGTPVRQGRWVSRPGRDAPALLGVMGMAQTEMQRLLADGTLAIG